MFYVLEGIDRSGKTTQAKLLVEYLQHQGRTVKHICFPDRTTPIGQMLDQYLKSGVELDKHACHLLFSTNRWECQKLIRETLAAGVDVVCDRYWYSGVAYSVANGLDLDWCLSADAGLIVPDKVFFLNIRPQATTERAEYGQERYEKLEFQQQVAAGYLQLMSKNLDNWVVIPADLTPEEVSMDIQNKL
jgi:dTMP kinase